MNFASDNAAGVAPAVIEALGRVNGGFALGYGADATTEAVERRFAELFERDVAVFLVPTGTAANALALAHVAPPWGAVLCHHEAHIATSECGAPEFFGGGLKLIGLPGDGGRIAPATLKEALASHAWGGPHHVTAAALSLTQVTEAGTVYRPDDIRRLADIAHGNGMLVHMDGARFANALVPLDATPAEMSWRAGIDVLSLGLTKDGAMAAEAVVFFDPARAADMAERRKRAGHLISKHRFLAAQFEALFADGLWLALAGHANAKAARLAQELDQAGIAPVWPVEANLLFVLLPADVHARLQAAGARYYAMRKRGLPPNAVAAPDAVLARLVTSFATTDEDIGRFIAALA